MTLNWSYGSVVCLFMAHHMFPWKQPHCIYGNRHSGINCETKKEEVSKLELLILRRTCQNGILPVMKICYNPLGYCHKSLFQSRVCWRIPDPQTCSSAGVVNTVCVGWAHSLTSGAAFNSSHRHSLCSSAHKNILQRIGFLLHYIKNTQNHWWFFFCILLVHQNSLCHLKNKQSFATVEDIHIILC